MRDIVSVYLETGVLLWNEERDEILPSPLTMVIRSIRFRLSKQTLVISRGIHNQSKWTRQHSSNRIRFSCRGWTSHILSVVLQFSFLLLARWTRLPGLFPWQPSQRSSGIHSHSPSHYWRMRGHLQVSRLQYRSITQFRSVLLWKFLQQIQSSWRKGVWYALLW